MRRSPILYSTMVAAIVALAAACDSSAPLAIENDPVEPVLPGGLPAGYAAPEGAAAGTVVGLVQSLDPFTGTLTLAGGVKVQLTTLSLLDPGGDLTTLAAVKAALDAGIPVLCDVDGFLDLGIVIVATIRFDTSPCGSCGGHGGDDGSEEPPGSGGSGGNSPPSPNTSIAEFGGYILQIDTSKEMFVIVGGLEVWADRETVVTSENGCNCETLSDVKNWMDQGSTVNARIRGLVQNGITTPKSITFQLLGDPGGHGGSDDGNDEGEGKETKGTVVAVDLNARIVTLLGGKQIKVATDALILLGSDFLSLARVEAALAAGIKVRIEAIVVVNAAGILEVTTCRFVQDEGARDGGDDEGHDDDPKDDGPKDDELVLVSGIVASINLLDGTCRTTDGKVIRIVSGSVIDLTGDLLTLIDVALRVTLGIQVRVEALGILSVDTLIASRVKFLI